MNKTTCFLLIIFCFSCIIASSQKNRFTIGINLCGPEFGEKNIPGTMNVDYTYPDTTEVNYFANKGFKIINLPFRWERIQRNLGGELDSFELKEMKKFVAYCCEKDIKVILSMQNFGQYRIKNKNHYLGSRRIKELYFKEVWNKIAKAFDSTENIFAFDIMNEPHDLGGNAWLHAAQEAINGIRTINKDAFIIIDGENFSYTEDWAIYNDKLKKLEDPSDKIIYDGHCYFDYTHSGRYGEKRIPRENLGIKRVEPFVNWLQKHNKNGMIGEFGVPSNDTAWLPILNDFLRYLSKNNIPANYWAAGRWWKDCLICINPEKDKDKPQMAVLEKFLLPRCIVSMNDTN